MLPFDGIGRFFRTRQTPPPKPTCTTNIDIRGREELLWEHTGRSFCSANTGVEVELAEALTAGAT